LGVSWNDGEKKSAADKLLQEFRFDSIFDFFNRIRPLADILAASGFTARGQKLSMRSGFLLI
jgi:hypothetical protein